jgi:CDP-alcohol phosphatidyltransferase
MNRTIEVATYLREILVMAYRSFSRGGSSPGSFFQKLPTRSRTSTSSTKKFMQRLNTTIKSASVVSSRGPATVRLLVRLHQHRRTTAALKGSWSKRLANLVTTATHRPHPRLAGFARTRARNDDSEEESNLHHHSSSAAVDDTSLSSSSLSWLEQAQSLPNLITMSRIASAPLLGYFIATEQTNYALIGCGLAGLSDWLDGHVARKYHLATKLGSYLDPLGTQLWPFFLSLFCFYLLMLFRKNLAYDKQQTTLTSLFHHHHHHHQATRSSSTSWPCRCSGRPPPCPYRSSRCGWARIWCSWAVRSCGCKMYKTRP